MTDRETLARSLHFDFCDQMGWPNGQPTWDELPDKSLRNLAADTMCRETWLSMADAAIAAMRPVSVQEDMISEAANTAIQGYAESRDMYARGVHAGINRMSATLRALARPDREGE